MSEIPTFWGQKFIPEKFRTKRTDGRRWWLRFVIWFLCVAVAVPTALIPSFQRYQTVKTSIRSLFGDSVNWQNSYVQLAQKTLQRLPNEHLVSLEKISINHKPTHESRGKANSAQLILNTDGLSASEFLSVFLHEIGHVVDLGVLKSEGFEPTSFQNTKVGDASLDFYTISWDASLITRSGSKKADFVSEYAQESAYEDMAESYLFYFLHGKEFRTRAALNKTLAKKYEFLKTVIFKDQEYDFSKNSYDYPDTFFDTTLLPFDFWEFFDQSVQTSEVVKEKKVQDLEENL